MNQKEMRRRRTAAVAARDRRRRKRKKTVRIQKAILAIAGVLIICGGTLSVWALLPNIKIAKQLEEADQYVEAQSYDEAIASCEEALKIDSKSIKVYKTMAGVYLDKKDRTSAEQILFQGWETTGDEGLLQEYCVHLLNDAVSDINSQNCTLATFDKCVLAIESGDVSADCYKLLDACYEKLFCTEEAALFYDVQENGQSGFEQYLEIMTRLLKAYEANPSDELKAEVVKYAVPKNACMWMSVEHIQRYRELLGQSILSTDEAIMKLSACLDKALWVEDTFAEAFTIFDSDDFTPIKDFMQTETYMSIRDQFIEGTMDYWNGKTYIPVSREKLKLMYEDEEWTFAFADYEECPDTKGIIQVWGAKQEDAGVQRLCISYEPASIDGEYYPHTTYEFLYLLSNVQIGNEYVPQMNYRFETRVATPEGTTTQLIGDWGGEHQWTTEY